MNPVNLVAPLILALPLLVFWGWMFRDMTHNPYLPDYARYYSTGRWRSFSSTSSPRRGTTAPSIGTGTNTNTPGPTMPSGLGPSVMMAPALDEIERILI